MKFHPISEVFPMMSEPDLLALRDDIKANGQREPITVLEGKILDGRNRFKACASLGIEPVVKAFPNHGTQPLDYVLSMNIHRRHLTTAQRAAIAALCASKAGDWRVNNVVKGKVERTAPLTGRRVEYFGKALSVNQATVGMALALLRKDKPLFDKVMAGKVAVKPAYRQLEGVAPAPQVDNRSDASAVALIRQMGRKGWCCEVAFESGEFTVHFYGQENVKPIETNWHKLEGHSLFWKATNLAYQRTPSQLPHD